MGERRKDAVALVFGKAAPGRPTDLLATGRLVYAAAGLLTGRPATTH